MRTEDGARVVYDVDRNVAFFGLARVDGPALVWEVGRRLRRETEERDVAVEAS